MRTSVAILVCTATFVAFLNGSNLLVAAGPPVLRNFKELNQVARQLESAEILLNDDTAKKSQEKRFELLYQFAREPKTSMTDSFWEEAKKVALEFKSKADQYVDDNRTNNNQNWFTNIVRAVGNPMGAMKGMSRFDPFLGQVAERYEKQAKVKKPPTKDDVVCDVSRLKMKSLATINFVLNTDVKHLIIGQRSIVNRAVFERLKSNKFISSTNFYSVHQLNDSQRNLLLNYYQGKVNYDTTPISDLSDNVLHPSELIIGRLLESCQTLLKYNAELDQELAENEQLCSQSKSDPNAALFNQQTRISVDRDTPAFCQALMVSL